MVLHSDQRSVVARTVILPVIEQCFPELVLSQALVSASKPLSSAIAHQAMQHVKHLQHRHITALSVRHGMLRLTPIHKLLPQALYLVARQPEPRHTDAHAVPQLVYLFGWTLALGTAEGVGLKDICFEEFWLFVSYRWERRCCDYG